MAEHIARRKDVELSAKAREIIGHIKAAHDDPKITLPQFQTLLEALLPSTNALPVQERRYVFMEVSELALRNILDSPALRVTGMGTE